jgi:hypothetical protein
VYTKPELLAIRPNEVWSWDISKLKGPAKWMHFHLYVILDIFSRYVVGWMIAHRETAELAEQLIADTIDKQNIVPGTLTLHADRGTSMRSKSVAQLLVDLNVTKTHSRPHVSDDNPYSEAQFKTLKYRHDFPARFGSIEDARAHCQQFFRWYNTEHRHSGIALMPPDTVHYGRSTELTTKRAVTLDAAFAAHPARFKGVSPRPPSVPLAAWINPPKKVNARSNNRLDGYRVAGLTLPQHASTVHELHELRARDPEGGTAWRGRAGIAGAFASSNDRGRLTGCASLTWRVAGDHRRQAGMRTSSVVRRLYSISPNYRTGYRTGIFRGVEKCTKVLIF